MKITVIVCQLNKSNNRRALHIIVIVMRRTIACIQIEWLVYGLVLIIRYFWLLFYIDLRMAIIHNNSEIKSLPFNSKFRRKIYLYSWKLLNLINYRQYPKWESFQPFDIIYDYNVLIDVHEFIFRIEANRTLVIDCVFVC